MASDEHAFESLFGVQMPGMSSRRRFRGAAPMNRCLVRIM